MASGAITEAAELIRKFMKHLNLRKQNGNGMKIDEQESFFFPSFPFSNLCLVVWYELSKYKLLFFFPHFVRLLLLTGKTDTKFCSCVIHKNGMIFKFIIFKPENIKNSQIDKYSLSLYYLK